VKNATHTTQQSVTHLKEVGKPNVKNVQFYVKNRTDTAATISRQKSEIGSVANESGINL
jgi:hypothetical protein